MDNPDDPGGRSGVFPRVDPRPPAPSQADSPAPRRPTPNDRDHLDGDAPTVLEGEDPARYDDDSDPAENDPEGDEG